MPRNLYLAYGITMGLHLIYGVILLVRYLRVRNKAKQLWPQED